MKIKSFVCKNCHETVKTMNNRFKFCSKKCRILHKNKRMSFLCKQAGLPTTRYVGGCCVSIAKNFYWNYRLIQSYTGKLYETSCSNYVGKQQYLKAKLEGCKRINKTEETI